MSLYPMHPGPNANTIRDTIANLEEKLVSIKQTIEQVLQSLEMQDQASWTEMLDQYSTIANSLSQIQEHMRKSGAPDGTDIATLLRTHLTVPQKVSLDVDPALQQASEGRIHSWNHDVVPTYLRTKLNPEPETDEKLLMSEALGKMSDQTQKQITNVNKNVDNLANNLPDFGNRATTHRDRKQTYNPTDTAILAKFVWGGRAAVPEPERAKCFSPNIAKR